MYFFLMPRNPQTLISSLQSERRLQSVDDARLLAFASSFIDGFNDQWISPKIVELTKLHGFEPFNESDTSRLLEDGQEIMVEANINVQQLLKSLVGLADSLRVGIDKLHGASIPCIPEKSYLEVELQELLGEYIVATETLAGGLNTTREPGRKKDHSLALLVQEVIVRSAEHLDIYPSNTNTDTRFNAVLACCFDYARIESRAYGFHIKPYFESLPKLRELAGIFLKHDRLDLFWRHAENTPFLAQVRNLFED